MVNGTVNYTSIIANITSKQTNAALKLALPAIAEQLSVKMGGNNI